MGYRLQDLIDVPKFQELLDRAYDAFDLASAILDNKANVLTASGWQKLCTDFHRVNPKTLEKCQASDMYILDHLEDAKPSVSYNCALGLVDCATPIFIDGEHLGNVFIGQFFTKAPDLEHFRAQAETFGFDVEAYLEAVRRVPVISQDKMDRSLAFVRSFTEFVGQIGLERLRDLQTTEALRQSEARFKGLVEHLPQRVFLKDTSSAYVACNTNYAQDMGLDGPDDIAGLRDYDLCPRELADKYHADDARIMATDCSEEREETYARDGQLTWVRKLKTPYRDADGQIMGVFGIFEDITEQKRASEQIRELNTKLEQRVQQRTAELGVANRELETFAYSVSHDLRSPLRGIDGWSLALLEDYGEGLDETARKYLDTIRAEAARMGKLIDALLGLSRVTRAGIRRAPIDLAALAQPIVERLRAESPERSAEFVLAHGLQASADEALLGAVLENLIENAWKFTAQGEFTRIEVGVTEREGERTYFVADNGAGFDMAYAGKLFAPFQRVHRAADFPGTGIGLATVQRIIHRHGGRVWAEGEVNKGATIYFTL